MKHPALMFSRSRRSERGVTLPMVAVSIAVLLAIAALAIDLGVLYTARTSAQHAVDAAALAGAYTFQGSYTRPQPATAANAIKAVIKANSILGKHVNLDSIAVIDDSGNGCAANVGTPPFICVDSTNQRVTVAAAGPGATSIEVYFAKILGLTNVGVAAMATAEAGKGASGTNCLKPIFMPSSGDWTNCSNSIFSGDQLNPSLVGTHMTFWPKGKTNANNWIMNSSEDGLLALDQNPGGKGIKDMLGFDGCINMKYKCGDTAALAKPGGTNGPVKQGVQDMIGNPPDLWKSVGQYCYQGNCSDIRSTSRSVATVIVWDCQAEPLSSGRDTVTVAGYAQVFIDGVANSPSTNGTTGGISAHLISAAKCEPGSGGASGGESGGGTGPVAGVPVRLIQTPTPSQ